MSTIERRIVVRALVLCAVSGCGPAISALQPNLQRGGRAVSISVHPSNAAHLFVASESGGLFFSSDGGVHFQHVDSLPTYSVVDVAYSLDGGTVIATAWSDFHNGNGPIWRSLDEGRNWTQPTGATPPAGPRCADHPSGLGLSFEPGSANVYAGTDCGLNVSSDGGAKSWTLVVADATVAVNDAKTQNRVWSVAAQAGGRVNFAADDGVWYRSGATDGWHRAQSGPGSAMPSVIHAFAPSPYNNSHLALAGSWNQLYFTSDGGAHWTLQSDTSLPGGRPICIRGARTSGGGNQVDLWMCNGNTLLRRTVTDGAEGFSGGSWSTPAVDHADPADVGFDVNGAPVLLATDGGVHRTGDRGANWTLTGGGSAGYNALQITEVTGQAVTGSAPHQDLYFGTQDNGNWASADGGGSWPNDIDWEGFFIRTEPTSVDHSGVKVTGVACSGCSNYITDFHYTNFNNWTNPPNGDCCNPFLISPGIYIQNTVDSTVNPPVNVIKLTRNTGGSWTTAYTIPQGLVGPPLILGNRADPVIYQAVARPGTTPDGQSRIGLVKITGLFNPSGASIADADGSNFGSIGIFPTMFAWYPVFGGDPTWPQHLIVPDVANDWIIQSVDSGGAWTVDSGLFNLVTQGGASRFRVGPFPIVHTVAFDPANFCHVLVGTAGNGVFRSGDDGATWAAVDGSAQIGNLSSFYFPPTGNVFISSYGRGLWTLNDRRTDTCPPPNGIHHLAPIAELGPTVRDPSTGVQVPLKDLGNPEICPACTYLIVDHGAIAQLQMKGTEVERVVLVGGTLHQVDAKKNEVPLAIPNSYGRAERAGEGQVFADIAKARLPIRGLVVEGTTLRGIITSRADLPFTPARTPYVRVLTADMRGGTPRTESGGTIIVAGEGFAPSGGDVGAARVRVDGQVVAEAVAVDGKGNFRVEVPVQRPIGDYDVAVEQQEGKRLTIEKSRVKVVPTDPRDKAR